MKSFLSNKYIKPFKNFYVLGLIVFAIWMLFADRNSYLFHKELNKEIDKKEASIKYYEKEIEKDQKEYKKLNNDEGLEKFAREEYYMKKENEEIYLIEYEDSIAKQKEEKK